MDPVIKQPGFPEESKRCKSVYCVAQMIIRNVSHGFSYRSCPIFQKPCQGSLLRRISEMLVLLNPIGGCNVYSDPKFPNSS